MKSSLFIIIALAIISKVAGETYFVKLKGKANSTNGGQEDVTAHMRLEYWRPFSMEQNCDVVDLEIRVNNDTKYYLNKMYLGGPDSGCGWKTWGGTWQKRKNNIRFSLFERYSNSSEVNSYFQYDKTKMNWEKNNNTILTLNGVFLPNIIKAEPEGVEMTTAYGGIVKITANVTFPLAFMVFLTVLIVQIMYMCTSRKGAVPYFSNFILFAQCLILILIARRFTEDNSLWLFYSLVIPMILIVIASLIALVSNSQEGARSLTLMVVGVYLAILLIVVFAFPNEIPFVAPLGILSVAFECKKYSKNKGHAQSNIFAQTLACFAILLYLGYPGTPADINPGMFVAIFGLVVLVSSLFAGCLYVSSSENIPSVKTILVINNSNSLGHNFQDGYHKQANYNP